MPWITVTLHEVKCDRCDRRVIDPAWAGTGRRFPLRSAEERDLIVEASAQGWYVSSFANLCPDHSAGDEQE